jgi:glutathione S-transferase
MSLTLYFHPLSSYCHKVLIALYENDTPFERRVVNLMDAADAAAFKKIWPCGQFPVLQDGTQIVPESSVIIEYLDAHHPGRTRFIPIAPERAWQIRLKDRLFDLQLHVPMQRVVGDRLRPEGKKDPHGVEQAKTRMDVALDMFNAELAERTWAAGDQFSLADCSAGPPLFYINRLFPLADRHKHAAAYLDRLLKRPSYARVIDEARPYFSMLPI